MPATVSHVLSATTPDNTSYEIRPSHWNSAHAVSLNISATEISGLFGNSNGISWGTTGGSITASHNGLTTAALSNHSHGNPTLNLTNLSGTTGSNSAGLTLSLSAASQTNQTAGLYALGNTTQSSSGTQDARSLSFRGEGVASVGVSNGSVVISVANAGGADGFNRLAAGTQTAGTLQTVNFADSNGISFGMSGSSQITASHNGLTTARASNDGVGLNTALTAGPLAWTVNSSGISLNAGSAAGTTSGFGGNLISGSMTHNTAGLNLSLNHPAWLTTAAQSNHSHGNPTLALTNLSGTTGSNSAGLTLSLSAAAPGGGGTISAYAQSNTTQSSSGTFPASSVQFQGNGGVSVGVSNGSVVLSAPGTSSLSGTGALSISTNGATISLGVGTVTMSATGNTTQGSSGTVNLNGLIVRGDGVASAGVSNGSIVVSVANAGGADGFNRLAAGTQTAGTLQTVNFADSNGISFGMSGSSQITASHNGLTTAALSNHSHGNPQLNLTNLSGTTASGSAGFTLSLSAGAGGAENNWHHLLGNTAGNSTASGTTVALSGGNNITLSGTNGSVIRIDAPASSSLAGVSGMSFSTNGSTISAYDVPRSMFRQMGQITAAGTAQANSLVSVQPFQLPFNVAFSNVLAPVSVNVTTSANNSSGYVDVSATMVIYTRNSTSLGSVASFNNTYTVSFSSNATGTVTGVWGLALTGNATTLTAGEYYAALHLSTTNTATGGANTTALANTFSVILSASIGSAANMIKVPNNQTNNTLGAFPNMGLISTGATLSTLQLASITATGTRGFLAPFAFELRNDTNVGR